MATEIELQLRQTEALERIVVALEKLIGVTDAGEPEPERVGRRRYRPVAESVALGVAAYKVKVPGWMKAEPSKRGVMEVCDERSGDIALMIRRQLIAEAAELTADCTPGCPCKNAESD